MYAHEPDIAALGGLIGHPARAAMLVSLLSGKAHTATELAIEADVTAQTASSHLAKLVEGELLVVRKQGRHKYFQLKDQRVAMLLEQMLCLGAAAGGLNKKTGPADPQLRQARVCYDHLAGRVAVTAFTLLEEQGLLQSCGDQASLTPEGERHFNALGYQAQAARRVVCRACLDWSERRSHLAGDLGQWLLDMALTQRWAERDLCSRAVIFSESGEKAFLALFRRSTSQAKIKNQKKVTFA